MRTSCLAEERLSARGRPAASVRRIRSSAGNSAGNQPERLLDNALTTSRSWRRSAAKPATASGHNLHVGTQLKLGDKVADRARGPVRDGGPPASAEALRALEQQHSSPAVKRGFSLIS